MGDTLLTAFFTSDIIGQGIVVLLLVLNIRGWGTMLTKVISLWNVDNSCKRFLDCFKNSYNSPIAMAVQFRTNKFDGPLTEIYKAGIRTLLDILEISNQEQPRFFREGRLPRKLIPEEIEKIRASMNLTMTKQSEQLEDGLVGLGNIVSVSPLLGLFGTVWGVMMTFIGIAKVGKPDIMAIAPGISGALLTTVAGLFVAIPNSVANNWINGKIDTYYRNMEIFIEDFISSLRLEEISRDTTARSTAMSQPDFGQDNGEANAQ